MRKKKIHHSDFDTVETVRDRDGRALIVQTYKSAVLLSFGRESAWFDARDIGAPHRALLRAERHRARTRDKNGCATVEFYYRDEQRTKNRKP